MSEKQNQNTRTQTQLFLSRSANDFFSRPGRAYGAYVDTH